MKAFTIIKRSLLGLVILPALLLSAGKASAAQTPWDGNGPLPTTSTPQFNAFSNIPNGVGDESDFVRVRPSNGDPTYTGTNGSANRAFVDSVNAACNAGDMFDVQTYIHNGADSHGNPDEGTGVAVATDTTVAMTAPLNAQNTHFTFASTISASNAASVYDTGKLNCDNGVKLEVVPGTVKVYTSHLGWMDATVDAVNGTIRVGSRVFGSGDMWGCWNERIRVVYTVRVVQTPPAPIYSCDLLTATVDKINNKKYHFAVNTTARNGAVLNTVTYDYGDGQTGTDADHTYAKNEIYNVSATVTFTVDGQVVTAPANNACKTVTVKKYCEVKGKENLPVDSADCKETPKVLPNTGMGAGSAIAIFGTTSVLGAFVYRMRALRSMR